MTDIANILGGTSGIWKLQIFTSSGTWTCPAPNTEVFVLAVGGGGATGGTPTYDGGSSSFGSLVTANGGAAGAGTASAAGGAGGAGYVYGQSGGASASTPYNIFGEAGRGAPGFFGIGNGGHGRCQGATNFGGTGGGGSGYVNTYSGTVSANQTVTVGAGGTYSTVSQGGNGAVFVWYKG